MRLFVTGATGLVGGALVPRLLSDGHEVVAWVRSERQARNRLGREVELLSTRASDAELLAAMERADAVIHLAGENVLAKRWTAGRKRALVDSRVETTTRIADAMRAASRPPAVLLSASAIGYYPGLPEPAVENDAPGSSFLADLCVQWEAAARAAASEHTRVALIRIGIVFGYEGTALQKMATPVRAGIGGRLGTGEQPVSWIHIDDLVELLVFALHHPDAHGPINATAPNPVTNRELTTALGKHFGRATPFTVPAFALEVLLGEAAEVVLHGARVRPDRLERLGFTFRYPDLAGALDDLLGTAHDPRITAAERPPEDFDRARGKPVYQLSQELVVDAPIEEAFAFFSEAANLGLITPPWTGFEMTDRSTEDVREGTTLQYRLRLGPVPFRWKTLIARWQPTKRFVDLQERGPYRLWWHEHRFEAQGDRTRVLDRVYYTVPLGPVGRLVNRLFVAPALRRIFSYRSRILALRFGPGAVDAPRRAA